MGSQNSQIINEMQANGGSNNLPTNSNPSESSPLSSSRNNIITNKSSVSNVSYYSNSSIQHVHKNRDPLSDHGMSKESIRTEPSLISYTFRWRQSGSLVFITGTFTNWTHHLPMRKIGVDFIITVQLTPTIHQYKFIVDGEWKYSVDYQCITDGQGNVNNIIDLKQKIPWESGTHLMSQTSNFSQNGNNVTMVGNKSYENRSSVETSTAMRQNTVQIRTTHRSEEKEFAEEAPAIPPHLLKIHYLKEKELNLAELWTKRPDTAQTGEKGELPSDMVLRKMKNHNALTAPKHVTVNHVGRGTNTERFFSYCVTQRFKAKYTTYQFYTCKYNNES